MPSLFRKSGSTAGRAKTRNKSIRGTISAPIPIPQNADDDEFPIRNPGSTKASTTADDEFPMRMPGTGIATPLPLTEGPGTSPDEPPAQPAERGPRELQAPTSRDRETSPESSTEHEDGQGKLQVFGPTGTSASAGGSGGSRTDLDKIRPQPPSTPPPTAPAASPGPITSAARLVSRPESRSPPNRSLSRKSSPARVSPSRVSPPRASPPARRATNPVLSTIRYSVASEAPSKQTAQSKDAPQRKKSTLRSALGRLFGRGRNKNAGGTQDPGAGSETKPGPLGSVQHRSDPTALGRPNQRSPGRAASLPLSEYDRPLRSHSIGPDDIMAIESARNSLQAEAAGSGAGAAAGGRRRAATTGGHALLRPQFVNREWGAGLSPRPASAQGRASRADGRSEPEDPNEIGRAITSDSGGGALRRRSRSLSGLQDFAGVRRAGRRRSDEIRYWRESYDPGFMSPLSSNGQEDIDDTVIADLSAPGSPAVEMPKTPPQPFNFGLLSKEMAGTKITHAADMATRLGDVESRTVRLERVVDQLRHAVPGFKENAILKDTATPGSASDIGSRSQNPLVGERSYRGSLHPSSPSPSKTPGPSANTSSPSPKSTHLTSNPTIRGSTSLPVLGRESAATIQDEQIAQLRSDLEAERAARQALEAQVKKLSERLNSLSTTMFAMVRAPSESRSQERLALPPSSAKTAPPMPPRQPQLSVFETDDDDNDEDASDNEVAGTETQPAEPGSLLVQTKTDSKQAALTGDDFEEKVGTPIVGYGAFGEELKPDLDDDDDEGGGGDNGGEDGRDETKRKKAARTLSLSQLTLVKGQRVRV
ncbi:hypothetical protein VTI74DRAFT_1659 [Chaetomium olivicolor]